MSCDFGVWYPYKKLTPEEAQQVYKRLCDGDHTAVRPHPSVDAFYEELTASHPEIDDVPETQLDDHEFCPWSCAMDRSVGSIIIASVWSRADQTKKLLLSLTAKHGLTLYDPQTGELYYPPAAARGKPWWRFW